MSNTNDVFTTDAPASLELVINGQSTTVTNPQGTIKSFAIDRARSVGIRTFSVYSDSQKVTEDQGNNPVQGVRKLEIVAKDARG